MNATIQIKEILPYEKIIYKCLYVIGGENESEIDLVNNTIFIKTAVDNPDFRQYEIRDISSAQTSAIAYLINDQSNKPIKGHEATHIIEHSFPASEIKTNGNDFVLKNEMIIMVFNDNSQTINNSDLKDLKDHIATLSTLSSREQVCAYHKKKKDEFAPREACGGVVVGS